jgi:hypothetical protein
MKEETEDDTTTIDGRVVVRNVIRSRQKAKFVRWITSEAPDHKIPDFGMFSLFGKLAYFDTKGTSPDTSTPRYTRSTYALSSVKKKFLRIIRQITVFFPFILI